MPAHRSERTIAQVLWNAGVVEHRSLHDTGWKNDLIASWIVICLISVSAQGSWRCHADTRTEITNIDRVCCHTPFITIRRLAQGRPFALHDELSY